MTTMTAPNRGYRAVTSLIRASRNPRVCSDCINKPQHRNYAVAAATLSTSEGTITSPKISNLPPVTATETPAYEIHSSIVLSRPPILTRPLSPFESSYYLYQKRLNERLAMPFTRYFYHKPDSPQDVDWKQKVKERNGVAARDIGGYAAYGKEGWNDEVLMGDNLAHPQTTVDALVRDAQVKTEDEGLTEVRKGEVEKPAQRHTEADKKRDWKRLDRKLARTLFLCVKKEDDTWRFPHAPLIGRENLHQAAERVLVQSAGINMNTWIVGRVPIGHLVMPPQYAADKTTIETPGNKTFFLKGRIMAGQANLEENQFGLKDFRWVTKEELAKLVGTQYYSRVRDMLGDR